MTNETIVTAPQPLTAEGIRKMEAGRELDLLIAREIMGFKAEEGNEVCIRCPSCGGWEKETSEYMEGDAQPHKIRCDTVKEGHKFPCDWRFQGCPHYSRDISAAWEVKSEITKSGEWAFELVNDGNGWCEAKFIHKKEYSAEGDGNPEDEVLCICRAALLAKLATAGT
jgi:hypothetical protein